MDSEEVTTQWQGTFENAELNALHADAFEHALFDDDWTAMTERFSLGWVTARHGASLVGFLNVVTDGGVHAWLQDVVVATRVQRQGLGIRLVQLARDESANAGCEWLHVDFDPQHAPFYFDACGFTPTQAGLIRLDGEH